MKLEDVISCLPNARVSGPREGTLTSITDDSRLLEEGGGFIAVRGHQVDGHQFISNAVDAGVTTIVAETAPVDGFTGTWIQVSHSRDALAILADLFAGSPSADLKVVGITGTNGKTTIAYLTHFILKQVRHRAGMIGTVTVDDGVTSEVATHTTPGALQLQSLLGRMRDNGCLVSRWKFLPMVLSKVAPKAFISR